jgi:hypothetical protein
MREIKDPHYLLPYISFILITLFPFIYGCAQPPTEEMDHAAQAISEAQGKEADLYAEDTFKKAEGALQRAHDLVEVKEYDEAKTAAMEAARLAKQARSMVESNKEKMREETKRMLENITISIDEVKILAARAFKQKAHINRADIQNFIDRWESELTRLRDNSDEEGLRHRFDKLVIIQKQIKHQKNNLNILLNQKET